MESNVVKISGLEFTFVLQDNDVLIVDEWFDTVKVCSLEVPERLLADGLKASKRLGEAYPRLEDVVRRGRQVHSASSVGPFPKFGIFESWSIPNGVNWRTVRFSADYGSVAYERACTKEGD